MKKTAVLLLSILTVCLLASCELLQVQDAHIPENHVSSEEHWDKNGIQDFTDFCVYRYDSSRVIESDSCYERITETDIANIQAYFDDFRHWMELETRLDEYSFNPSCISAGDYCFINTKEGQPIGSSTYGRFDDYTVYFFDVETLTLYYIHSNI